MLIIVVILAVGIVNLVTSDSFVQKDNELGITNMTKIEENDKPVDMIQQETKSKRNAVVDDINDVNDGNKELIETAESSNLVYRPLFVYRKIQHSKRRITMYNSFAG